MNLQPKYFDFIKDGTKRIELRLYDEKRQSIQLGDIIEFAKSDDEKFKAEVVGLLRYNSFADLFEDFDISILADIFYDKARATRGAWKILLRRKAGGIWSDRDSH